MSDVAVTLFELAALAVLLGFLFIKGHQRARNQARLCDPAQWTGRAIDVTGLRPAIEKVRHKGWAAQGPTIGGCFHKALLGLIRRNLTRSGYFQDKQAEEPSVFEQACSNKKLQSISLHLSDKD